MRKPVIAEIAVGAVGEVLLAAPSITAFVPGIYARLRYGGIAWIASVPYYR
jgi:hypothetical protein